MGTGSDSAAIELITPTQETYTQSADLKRDLDSANYWVTNKTGIRGCMKRYVRDFSPHRLPDSNLRDTNRLEVGSYNLRLISKNRP